MSILPEPSLPVLSRFQRGVVLVAVLWIVAALSLLVVAMSSTSRADLRASSGTLSDIQAAAQGDAAITLALLAYRAEVERKPGVWQKNIEFEGRQIPVRITPAEAYVSLNGAQEDLLQALFTYAGGLDALAAKALADRVLDWRDEDALQRLQGAERPQYEAAGSNFFPRDARFIAREDLLQVLGVDFALYRKLAGLITPFGDHAGVDAFSAPPALLRVLTHGDAGLATAIERNRAGNPPQLGVTLPAPALLGGSGGGLLRVDAMLDGGDGRLQRTRWVDNGVIGPQGEPWLTLAIWPVQAQPAE